MYNRHWARYLSIINLSVQIMNIIKLNTSNLVLILVLLMTSCRNQSKSGNLGGPVPIIPYTVQSENVVYYDTYPGTAVAPDEVQLRSEVSGFVTGIYFKEGSRVTKGMKLYEIDRRKYQAAFEEAKASVDIANANLLKAQRDADRYKNLDKQNAIAQQTLDDALTSLENARLQVKSAKASLLNAETDFNYSLIIAPFTGSIGFSLVKPGAFVTAGQTLLNTISSDNPIAIDFILDEKSLPYMLTLQTVKKTLQDSTFRLSLPDNSEYKYNGELSIIDRAIDPQTGTIKIRTVFPNPEMSLRPGMNCRIKVLNKDSGMEVNIPAKAIVEQMGEYFVYLIENNVVKQKRVSLGPNHGEMVVVKSGLSPGETIVLEGIQKVREGSTVVVSGAVKNEKAYQSKGTD
jgi:membrane fusion protein, multidrug efflux system